MRVLHVAPEPPGYTSGGKIVIKQSMEMLDPEHNEVDYIGPAIENEEIKKRYHKCYELRASTSKIEIIRTLLHFAVNKRYFSWKKLNLDFSKYDFVYLDFTKLDYVMKDIKKNRVPIIVRAHNVEYDYARRDYEANRGLKKLLVSKLSKKQEKYIVENADLILTLTKNDLDGFKALYQLEDNRIAIIPVCIDNPNLLQRFEVHNPAHLLITGSLWYGVNRDGIIWMIEKVLPLLKTNFQLRIAGARPSEDFKRLCKANSIELIDTPPSMKEHLEWSDAVVVPIFSGAGMKVKIAEALSYGKPVITTSFGAIGYDIDNGIDGFIGDSPEEFADCINSYCGMSKEEKEMVSKNAIKLFSQKYQTDAGKQQFNNILVANISCAHKGVMN